MALAAVRADPVSAAFLAPRAPAVVLADPVPVALSALVAPATVEADGMLGSTHAVWYRWVARDKFEH